MAANAIMKDRGSQVNKASKIIDHPITQITCKNQKLILNVIPKRTMVSSINKSHNPRVNRNFLNSWIVTFCPYRKALVPARKTKVGAQKWEIHRVKNQTGVVWVTSVGEKRVGATKSRTWSRAIITMMIPLRISMD